MERERHVSGIAGVIGKAAISAEFREMLLEDPEKAGKEFGLPRSQIRALAQIDRDALKEALSGIASGLPEEVAGHSSIHSSVTDHQALTGIGR